MISDRNMCYEENKSDGIESQGVRGYFSWEGFFEKVNIRTDTQVMRHTMCEVYFRQEEQHMQRP